MRLQFQPRRYVGCELCWVGFLVGVWLLPSTTPTGLLTTRNDSLNESQVVREGLMFVSIVGTHND